MIIYKHETDSTNEFFKRNWNNYTDKMIFLKSDIQTRGKGRLKRNWSSGYGGIWFSVLFRKPDMNPYYYQKLVSVSICSFLNEFSENFNIKWPNDIYTQGRKICGILSENIYSGKLEATVVGAGINVNNEIPEELNEKAVSLKSMLKAELSENLLFEEIVKSIEKNVSRSEAEIDSEWEELSLIREGNIVELMSEIQNRKIVGKVMVTPIESLILELENGEISEFRAGDVRLLKF